jgi:ABC-type arginine transport system permease subunit
MPFSIYFVAALIYLGLTALSEIGLREASKRASAGVQAAGFLHNARCRHSIFR